LCICHRNIDIMQRKYKSKDFPVDGWGLYNKETGENMEINTGKITLSTPTQEVMLNSKKDFLF